MSEGELSEKEEVELFAECFGSITAMRMDPDLHNYFDKLLSSWSLKPEELKILLGKSEDWGVGKLGLTSVNSTKESENE